MESPQNAIPHTAPKDSKNPGFPMIEGLLINNSIAANDIEEIRSVLIPKSSAPMDIRNIISARIEDTLPPVITTKQATTMEERQVEYK